MREYGFSLTCILPYTGEYGSVKTVFSHILCSVYTITHIKIIPLTYFCWQEDHVVFPKTQVRKIIEMSNRNIKRQQ